MMKLRHIRLLALLAVLPLAACEDDSVQPVEASRVRLLNAVTDAGSIHLRLDAGNITSSAVAYNNAPAYLRVRSGSRTLSVRASAGTADLISTNVNLATDQDYTYIYAGKTGATGTYAPRFISLADNGATPTGENGAVRVVHASVGAPAAVDVYLLSGTETLAAATPEFTGIDFAEVSNYVTAPAGTYSVVVTATGTKTAAITQADVTLAAGQKRTVAVIGDPATTAAAVLAVRVMTDN